MCSAVTVAVVATLLPTDGESFRAVLIVFVVDSLRPGNGTTVSALRTAAVLRAQGHQVRFLVHLDDGAVQQTEVGEIFSVPALRIPLVAQLSAMHSFRLARPRRAVIDGALRGADLVHVMVPTPLSAAARRAAEGAGVAVSAAFHVQPEHITYNIGLRRARWLDAVIYRLLWRNFYRYIRHVHCPSQFIARQLRNYGYGCDLHVISNGVPNEFRSEAAVDDSGDSEYKFRIVNVGRLSPEKCHAVLIDAVAQSAYRDRIRLEFCGRGPHRLMLWARARRRGVRPVIGYHATQDLIAILRRSDLYVHAADAEIESIACLEAIACGLVPVIADSPWSAASQFALDARSLFPRGDAAALAERIDYWIENPQQRRAMAARYAEYADGYRLRSSVTDLLKMFEQAISDAALAGAAR